MNFKETSFIMGVKKYLKNLRTSIIIPTYENYLFYLC